MIFQGIFNILSLYLNEIDMFYNAIDNYFNEKINQIFKDNLKLDGDLNKKLEDLLDILKTELLELGFEKTELEVKFMDPFIELSDIDIQTIKTHLDLYELKIAPIIYEIFLEKIIEYLVDIKAIPILLNLKSKGFFELDFIVELRNFKMLLDNFPTKKENLKKYIYVREKFIKKVTKNKKIIESLEDLSEPKDKLQLIYLIYRSISFFHLEKQYDFSHIKEYLENNMKEWLTTIPLVTLQNPDLYFCGLFLAKYLGIPLDIAKVKNFLLDLYEEGIDEFESPLVEATDGLYYFLKSTNLMNLWLTESQVARLLETEKKFFEPQYLKKLETSQLVVILKLYHLLNIKNVEQNSKAILEEIENRVTSDGIKQYRDGFISAEATYYVLFNNFVMNTLEKLKDFDLLESIMSRIYRNLEILEFSADMNFDLISELFYSFESLKLFNCIETKEMMIHLANYLFPQEVVERTKNSQEVVNTRARFRHLKVNKMTGETSY